MALNEALKRKKGYKDGNLYMKGCKKQLRIKGSMSDNKEWRT